MSSSPSSGLVVGRWLVSHPTYPYPQATPHSQTPLSYHELYHKRHPLNSAQVSHRHSRTVANAYQPRPTPGCCGYHQHYRFKVNVIKICSTSEVNPVVEVSKPENVVVMVQEVIGVGIIQIQTNANYTVHLLNKMGHRSHM